MADLLSTLLTGGSGAGTKVTNSASQAAIDALQNAYNINLNAAQNSGVSGDIAAKAIAEATKGIQTGAAATRGSGAYSSAALQVAKDKAMAEAASAAAIENAKLQQQSAAQAAGAATNLANATKTATTGTADPKASQMLDIMKALAIGERTSAAASSGSTPSSGTTGKTGTTTGSTLGDTVANKALSYGGRIAQVGLTSMLGKAALGLNPVLGAGVMLAGSDVIKAGTGAVTDWLGEALGLKKKAADVTAAAAAVPDAGMVDFVNAANSVGFDMSQGTTVDASGFDESTNALADLMGTSQDAATTESNDSDWNSAFDAWASSVEDGPIQADKGGGNDDYGDVRDSLF